MRMVFLLGLVSVLSVSALFASENRTALLMNVGAYQGNDRFPALAGTEKDVQLLEAALIKLGFTVYTVADPDNSTARTAIDDFYRILRDRQGVGLFYFSGHGANAAGGNFLIPAKNTIERQMDYPSQAVSVQRVLNRMQEAKLATKLVFLDCSRSVLSEGLKTIQPIAEEKTFISWAMATGSAVSPTSDKGSTYAQALSAAFLREGESLVGIQKRVTEEVDKFSEGKVAIGFAVPEVSKIGTEFFLRPASEKVPDAGESDQLEVTPVAVAKGEFQLPDGTVQRHLDLKSEAEKRNSPKPSRVYFANYEMARGLFSLQFLTDGYVKGSFFVPENGREIRIYGTNHRDGELVLSLWESEAPLAGGLVKHVPPQKRPNMITWMGQLSSDLLFAFQREKGRQVKATQHKYNGMRVPHRISASLSWNADGLVKGDYRLQKNGQTHQLMGDHLMPQFLYLDDFHDQQLVARLLLTLVIDEGKRVWTGTSYGIDGQRTSFQLNQR